MSIPATVDTLGHLLDQEVMLSGWVYAMRTGGKVIFLQLRDGTGIVQCVVGLGDVGEELFGQVKALGQESSLVVWGVASADARAPGGFELHVKRVRVIQAAEGYPITKKEHGPAFLHDNRHLWLRSRQQQAILRIRHLAIKAIRDYLDGHGFLLLDSPILTPNACEGTSTLFETEYFGRKAYLSQSGQLYQEAGAMAFRRTYCFGPTFRAEKSATRRHLTEFWMVEPEVAFAGLDDLMDLCEDFLVETVGRVLEAGRPHLELLERDLSKLEAVQKPFPRLSYDDAALRLQAAGVPLEKDDDFGAPHEAALVASFDRPIMVHRYPTAIKAFYFKRDPLDPTRTLGVDVLAPEGYGEIIGGSEREDDLDTLLSRIDEHKLPRSAFEWYLDLRRWGTCPHAGFGLGVERFVTWLCGIHHIREAIPFPRQIDRLEP
jgi:asparaginyl-tRNA synthetase